jgi:hypothetical protein
VRRDSLIALALFALALWYNVAHIPTTTFHRDEARWIHRARFVQQFAHPLGSYWHDRDLMRGQPPLGSYLMGAGLAAQGLSLTTNGLWNFSKSDLWNQWHDRMPTREELTAARRTDAVVGALIVVAAYLIARSLANRLAGVVAALILIPHPLSVYLSSLADSDAILTLLVALATLAAIALAARPSWPRAILLGVLLGLGGSAKLSPILISVPLAGIGVLLLLYAWRRPTIETASISRRLGWRLMTLPLVAYATFVASFPYLWSDPFGRTLNLFRFRAQEMTGQGEIWDNLAITSRVEALNRIGNWLGDYHTTTGWLITALATRFGTTWRPVGLDLPLALIGAELLIVLVARHGLQSKYALAATILGAQVAAIVLGMRADFERYLFPILLAAAVCAGLVVGLAWDFLRSLVAIWRTRHIAVPGAAAAVPLRRVRVAGSLVRRGVTQRPRRSPIARPATSPRVPVRTGALMIASASVPQRGRPSRARAPHVADRALVVPSPARRHLDRQPVAGDATA